MGRRRPGRPIDVGLDRRRPPVSATGRRMPPPWDAGDHRRRIQSRRHPVLGARAGAGGRPREPLRQMVHHPCLGRSGDARRRVRLRGLGRDQRPAGVPHGRHRSAPGSQSALQSRARALDGTGGRRPTGRWHRRLAARRSRRSTARVLERIPRLGQNAQPGSLPHRGKSGGRTTRKTAWPTPAPGSARRSTRS